MNRNELEQFIIQSYQNDEQSMILCFAQWCVNNDLDPQQLYARAYPQQADNEALQQAIALTVNKEDADPIGAEVVQAFLSMFDNEELAFIVYEEAAKLESR
ncbi:hypothetical protein K0T92_00025 [Paenibacillus oenotherae]|uniref:YxiS n=1 Tax=Paenibacillus oenotherae TaxID=1435645 RepID=A0ABS7D177_9BACL|nr:hypothetical protein [Paenibacillus oenotherae]MBW7473121.1 hypothetical protein [Paenibacillus oenotherae]